MVYTPENSYIISPSRVDNPNIGVPETGIEIVGYDPSTGCGRQVDIVELNKESFLQYIANRDELEDGFIERIFAIFLGDILDKWY